MIEDELLQTIEKMTMEDDAATAARETIDAYIKEISAGVGRAESAALSVSYATANALSKSGPTASRVTGVSFFNPFPIPLNSHADGLDYVPYDGYIAELHEGERVLTASENRMITPALSDNSNSTTVFGGNQVSERKITLDINGSGGIGVPAGVDSDTVWNVVMPRLKDAVLGLLVTEIHEEGDRSYVF